MRSYKTDLFPLIVLRAFHNICSGMTRPAQGWEVRLYISSKISQ